MRVTERGFAAMASAARRARRRDLRRQARAAARGRLRPGGAGRVGARVARGADRAARGLPRRARQRRRVARGRRRRAPRCAPAGAPVPEDLMSGGRSPRPSPSDERGKTRPPTERLRGPWPFGSGRGGRGAVRAGCSRSSRSSPGCRWARRCSVLIGSRGLLPVADFIEAARAQPGVSFLDLPTLFLVDPLRRARSSPASCWAWCCRWRRCSGVARRLCFALSTLLYLSYVTVARDFLSFQWDNLLLECGLLAAFLPHRPAGARSSTSCSACCCSSSTSSRASPSGSRRCTTGRTAAR